MRWTPMASWAAPAALGAVLGIHQGLSAAERQLMLDTRARLHAATRPAGPPASGYSLIHADMHPGNVLVDGGRLDRHRLRRRGLGLACLRHRRRPGASAGRPDLAALERAYVAATGRAADFGAVPEAGCRCSGWFAGLPRSAGINQRPELKRSARFEETKTVVLEQCLSIGGTL